MNVLRVLNNSRVCSSTGIPPINSSIPLFSNLTTNERQNESGVQVFQIVAMMTTEDLH
ncbi:hypothetical protein M8C21_021164 [Ambrosia artemisiifolia]|uniref:Uncharacterized protein n=1 Tax=Ambrosia artemisiifolia TaxID=4212 RepID=A0AAD5GP92_AMBAR|nr:hypothetical protein M8C21_021164 [Ambrosia artemisiifolia]